MDSLSAGKPETRTSFKLRRWEEVCYGEQGSDYSDTGFKPCHIMRTLPITGPQYRDNHSVSRLLSGRSLHRIPLRGFLHPHPQMPIFNPFFPGKKKKKELLQSPDKIILGSACVLYTTCLSEKFFHHCSTHQNSLVRQIGDYTMSDVQQQYKKYLHKRTKHILL